ncbi:MAG TPA: alkaline phosphatase family protein [Candidatus Krumholzibacteria bacterium]|nr:alkaline phosphatase family protein [Candidatus Krumholzibacteria bacterium]
MTTRIVRVLALLLAAAALAGCGGEPARPTRKLVVIGVDSADWRLWEPMVAAGELPNLQKFMGESAHGRLKTFFPLEKSPLLWASICTGVTPDIHGVAHFVKGAEQEPVRGSAWKAPAIWDILGAAGLSTSVVGMWTTYPARPIDGVMVSDYLPYGHGREAPLANLVYPDSLTAAVVALRVDAADITDAQLTRFIDADRLEEAKSRWPERVEALREIWAADLTYMAVNRMLAAGDRYDLFFVYLRGTDMVSHRFYHYMRPQESREYMDPGEAEVFGQVVRRYYMWADEAMGEVLSWFPADRQVMVLSDHGFYGPRMSGDKGTAEHSEWGVLLVRSPLYQAGATFDHAVLLDACPTMLALIGLPAGGDMQGAVLAEALTPEGEAAVRRLEGSRLPTYMALTPREGPAGEHDAAIDEELRRQLKALGYIN